MPMCNFSVDDATLRSRIMFDSRGTSLRQGRSVTFELLSSDYQKVSDTFTPSR